jgi:Raf kinase inhibitor-like YbhB/YbcL family protein
LFVVLTVLPSCARDDRPLEETKRLTLQLTSPAFADGARIPKLSTCDGSGASPALTWANVPEGYRSFAIVCEDPDAPMGTFTHWVIYNIPAAVKLLPEGLPAEAELASGALKGARQAKNDFGKLGYGGPCPPSGTHHYVFRVYALDAVLEVAPAASRGEIFRSMKGHILAEGKLTGTYSRGG